MEINALTIYLWQLADRAISASGASVFVTLIIVAASGFMMLFGHCENEPKALRAGKKIAKIGIPFLIFFSAINTLVPSSNTIAMMVVIPKIAESKAIQQDLPEIYNAAVESLKEKLKK